MPRYARHSFKKRKYFCIKFGRDEKKFIGVGVGVGLEYEEKVEEDETVGVGAGFGREKKVFRVFQKLT